MPKVRLIHKKLSQIPLNNSIKKRTIVNSSEDIFDFKNHGVSIVTCTNRSGYLYNIFENYNKQTFEIKELIIILNKNSINLDKWTTESKKYKNVQVFQIDENRSLGYCLNYGISKAKYGIIAKFDDDDYYGPKYLSKSVKYLRYADVVGKSTSYVYFKNSKTLAIRNINRDNRYVYRVEGPTLVFKKNISNKIKFRDISLGEDIKFCKDCTRNGIKIYATDKYDYVYIRYGVTHRHAWSISDSLYLKLCKVIGKVDDYVSYIELSKKNRNRLNP